MFKVGIIGAGHIASVMAKTLDRMDDAECCAAASRSVEKAEAFCREHHVKKAYGSYEELLRDPEIDLVYIATPHSHHYEHMKLCIEYRKPVLCEKSFTMNALQAEDILEKAEKAGVFITEAIWTRYVPMREIIDSLAAEGGIGTPSMLTANLGYNVMHKERIAQPELAGGALLDVGVYPLNFAAMVFGTDIKSLEGHAVMTDKGVDAQESMILTYADGKMAVLNSSAICMSDRQGVIYGDRGYMIIENINNPQSVSVYDSSRKPVKKIAAPAQLTGYEYEVRACMEALEKGELQCPQMPHSETIRMMKWMDELRRQWGMVYPQEKKTGERK